MIYKFRLTIKRLFDIGASLIGIIVLSPLFIIVALSIKFTSNGPIFFKQKRLGLDGKIFEIIKFRTMIVNAEQIGTGLVINSESDNRITSIGSFLRKTSLDEIPQLINVLRGEMSIVGPRPPVVYFPYVGYDNYPEWAKERFIMRPGITGLSQVKVRNSVPWNERIIIDNEYVDKFTLTKDFIIILMTVKRIFTSENIYLESEV